jgi:hypothetical protein
MLAALAAVSSPVRSQTIMQQLVSPGPLAEKHAKYESKCESCHASFDRTAQSRLCLDCHKEVAADYAARRGFHGRIQPADRPCSTCHTDHEGREKDIVAFNPKTFDHRQTDYLLRDKHADVECASCHMPDHPFREAPSDCASCHRADDPHKRQFGDQCQSCHNEADWKKVRFDHSKTKFILAGAHTKSECAACHADEHWKIETTCVSCHRKEEPHKGQLVRCETCHSDADWKHIRFDHSKTKFVLAGAHAKSECASCHEDERWTNVATTCVSCHQKDDVHNGRLSESCGTCHSANNWQVGKFDHSKTTFPLLGKHADVRCETCHIEPSAKVRVLIECESCHQKDDTHKGSLGPDCGQCHSANDWKGATFDHAAKTKFALTGKHETAKCADCHAVGAATPKIETSCTSCHAKDDVHANQLGANCEQCHGAQAWNVAVVFDHGLVRFPLIGKHADVACAECHNSKRYKDAPVPCIDCHRDDDTHKTALGVQCGDCHNPISWADWSFDHNAQTRFRLDGAHVRANCADCHLPNEQRVKTLCIDCHRGEDVHAGRFGTDCGRCHTAASFKALRNRF